jgi:phosphate acetyltransferase
VPHIFRYNTVIVPGRIIMKALDEIIRKSQHDPRTIVLAEGEDNRIIEAAARATSDKLANIIVLGNEKTISNKAALLKVSLNGIQIIDPTQSEKAPKYAKALYDLRKAKGLTLHQAEKNVYDSLCFANMMVRCGDAEGSVAGSLYTTSNVVRNAIQLIGVKKGAKMVSSFFLMMLCEPFHTLKGGFIFSDCGLVIDPNEEQLAEIAMAASDSGRLMLNEEPKVAMLSFSTSGSASHEMVDKVVNATEIVRKKRPKLVIDGDVQLDAAIVANISDQKVKDSKTKGKANVLVFPNLAAGNIGYKMAERVGGAIAIGPILQGLQKPANDLSRGCHANDVYNLIAVTVVQAQAT